MSDADKVKVTGAFRLLAEPIRKALIERGFITPTEPQEEAIPLILKGYNILLIAPTGTGKTEAAVLPVFSKLLELRKGEPLEPGIYVLYVTPLRALNRDLLERLTWWGERLDIRVAVRHGDTGASERNRQARNPPEMLITTPETLQAILSGRIMRSHLSKIRWVIVDEVHELAEDKRGSQLSLALERLVYIADHEFQRIGLSATVGSPEVVGQFLVGTNRKVKVIKVPVARYMKLKVIFPAPKQIDYELSLKLFTHPEVAARLRLIRELMEKHRSSLLFVNTRAIAEVLASRFHVWDMDFPIGVHHGSLAKPSRIAAERGLKEGILKGLVSTSSLELGIDIGHIDIVIQYMSPRQVTRLVQRVGRSGHRIGWIAKGIVITADPDDTLEAAVICRRALKEKLEPISIPAKPLDVLTHQIVALLTLKRRWNFKEILDIYKRAYPYRNLTKDDLLFVLRYMHSRYPRLAWISEEDEVVLRPRNTRSLYDYFFGELSMIPDEKHYLVIDLTSNTPIGLLDEAFIAEYGEPGTKFVFRGSLWVIKDVTHDRVYVVPTNDPTGAIPSWIGEEIPVPYEIAQEVGSIRRFVAERLSEGKSLNEIVNELIRRYPVEKDSLYRALMDLEEQFKRALPIPSDKLVLIESWGNLLIFHTHLGTLGNRAIGRLLAEIATDILGTSVGVQQDPYRVVLQLPVNAKVDFALNLIRKLSKIDLRKLIRRLAHRSGLFKRRIIHVARRFGALDKSVDFSDISLRRLVDMFEGSPIYEEALKEFLHKDIDLEVVEKFLKRIRSGELKIATLESDSPSPLTRIAIERISRKTELIPPNRMHHIILEATKVRLLNEARIFICTENWDWYDTFRIKDLPDKLSCPKCGSYKIGVLAVDEKTAARLIALKGSTRSKVYARLIKDAIETANLIERYGKVAAIVLAGRRIRPTDAAKVLLKESSLNERLIELIVKAEREALRRKFF